MIARSWNVAARGGSGAAYFAIAFVAHRHDSISKRSRRWIWQDGLLSMTQLVLPRAKRAERVTVKPAAQLALREPYLAGWRRAGVTRRRAVPATRRRMDNIGRIFGVS